jgi:hypothetical protein
MRVISKVFIFFSLLFLLIAISYTLRYVICKNIGELKFCSLKIEYLIASYTIPTILFLMIIFGCVFIVYIILNLFSNEVHTEYKNLSIV